MNDSETKDNPVATAPVVLRHPLPGDLGRVIARHGEIYAKEYGYDERFEGLVAEIVGRYIHNKDPQRERFWIAEIANRMMGSVALFKEDEEGTARLRLFLVEPAARGRGVGKQLLDACLGFARSQGYQRITLTTTNALDAARHLYQRTGFRLVSEQSATEWGQEIILQEWLLDLGDADASDDAATPTAPDADGSAARSPGS